jgi:hypothetical protein
MRLDKKKLAFFVVWTICLEGRTYPQNTRDKLQPLVETSARRLAIAEQVALAKWDSGTPVEDSNSKPHLLRVSVARKRVSIGRGFIFSLLAELVSAIPCSP